MVRETNRYAEQHLRTQKLSSRSKTRQWEPTNNEEMLKLLGVIIEMGSVQMPQMDYYRSKSKLYGSETIQNTMLRDKFELLLKFFQFSKNEEEHALDLLKARFKSIHTPGSIITIDETMVPWRGRLLFKLRQSSWIYQKIFWDVIEL
jgi:hypothetical protein